MATSSGIRWSKPLNASTNILSAKSPLSSVSWSSPKYFSTCYSPWGCVYINVDGSLFPCMAVAMGNVKTTKLKDIIFSEKFTKFKNIIRQNGTINGCNRCGYLKPKDI